MSDQVADSSTGVAAPHAHHADILLVDDDAKTHLAMQAILGELGAELVSVTSGREALLRLLRQDFALILLDVQMPDMDGFATAELIRGRDKTRLTPIIFLTAYNQSDDHQLRGYSLGAVDFLLKPIVPAILRSKVQVFVELHRKNLELRRQAQLIREAEQREHERRLGDARARWEAEALRQTAAATEKRNQELAHLVTERDEAARALMHSNARLSLLSDTASRLLTKQRPRQLLDELFGRMTGHLELDVYAFRSLAEDGEHLVLEAHGGVADAELVGNEIVRLGEGLAGQCAVERQPVLVDAATTSQIYIGDLKTCVCFPLIADDRLIGTLAFGSRQARSFSAEDQATMELLVGQVAIALEREQMMEELQARNRELADTDRKKDEFLAMLGHELRNPLAPIVNALHVIGRSRDDKALARAQTTMERQVRHLVRLVDDLLDVSRITQGKIELRREKVDARAIVEQAVAIARPLINAREHELVLVLPEDPVELIVDVTRLTQVIANLLNNAAKYTNKSGRITLTVARGGDEDVVFSVRDTGIGLPTEMLPRVFELFLQGDHANDRAAGGLGIGLTLVKRLVQLHGGDVVAHSDGPGLGSEFVVSLPLTSTAPLTDERRDDDDEPPLLDPHDGLEILVIEDNPDIRETLKELLEICGHHVTLAEDGIVGLAAASNGVQHDVALVDIGLPGRDGYDVGRELAGIRKKSGFPTRLIAMTGYGQADDKKRALEAGFDAHLVKPVDPDLLTRLLASHASSRSQGET